MSMTIKLPPELEDVVRQKVVSGLYASESEVILDALRLMEERDRGREAKLAQLRREVQGGIDSGPSEVWDPSEVKSAGRARRADKSGKGI